MEACHPWAGSAGLPVGPILVTEDPAFQTQVLNSCHYREQSSEDYFKLF